MEKTSAIDKVTSTRVKKILLSRTYMKFFVPSLIAAVALSLSEFVDSIVVSNLLDTQALSIVNVCVPIVTLMCAVYVMLSVGGVMLYTERRGKSDPKGANTVFTVCLVTGVLAGVFFLILGQIFLRQFGELLCPGLILGEDLLSYIRVLLYSMPVLIAASIVMCFLPAAGNPNLSMGLNVFANILNLILDYVYIRIFGMGVTGAAAATLTSFITACVLLLVFYKNYDLRPVKTPLKEFKCLKRVVQGGAASSLTQISFSIKFAYCNAVAAELGGTSAIAAMSLNIQTMSIISIVAAGAADTIRPFLSLLRTQHDYDSTAYIFKKALRIIEIWSIANVVILELFPGLITALYNATEPEIVAVAYPAIRIVSICFLFRMVCMTFMNYVSILGITPYSLYISLFDGFAGIVPIGMILSRIFGLTGLWMTFPVNAVLLVCSIIVINRILCRKYPDRFTGVLLLEKDAPGVKVLDLAIEANSHQEAYISQEATEFCLENGVERKTALKIGLIAEETAVYIQSHCKGDELLNMLLQKKDEKMWLYFRSIGSPYDLTAFTEDDVPENYKLLKAMIPDYQYNYTMGMNNLRVKFNLEEGN